MRSKHYASLGILLAVFALSAMANILASASATADCNGYTLTMNSSDLTAGTTYTIDFTFTLTCGGSSTIVPGSKTFTATGTTATVTATGTWPTSPLTTDCTVSMGSATLTSSGSTINNFLINGASSASLTCAIPLEERMTGGGSVIVDPPGKQAVVTGETDALTRVTHGFEIHCGAPPETPNNLEVNWPGNRFHLENLTLGGCVCNPAFLPPDNPDAGFNEFIGAGTGKLNGVEGASIAFIFTDQGEPGTNDTEQITIEDPAGVVVLTFSQTNITFGNQQAHREGGPKVPPCTL